MKLSKTLEQKISNMTEGKNKEKWSHLQETDKAYVTILPISKIEAIYKSGKGYFYGKPLEALEYERQYYYKVFEVYNNHDFILDSGIYESYIHVNEIEYIEVTEDTKNKILKIIERINNRIDALKKINPPQALNKNTLKHM